MFNIKKILFFLLWGIGYLYSQTTLVSAEYYVNTDPGLGNGIPLTSVDGSFDGTLEDVDFNVLASDLGIGIHTLYVRFQDATGTWSIPQEQDVIVTSQFEYSYTSTTIAAAEYYIDVDPGPGNGTPITAADGSFDGTLEDVEFTISAEEITLAGHLVYIRFQDNLGAWSIPQSQFITVSLPFNNYNVNPYEDIVILDWGFNNYHMLTIENDAMQFMDNGDQIHIIDENGIIAENCSDNDIYGMVSVASSTFNDISTNPYNLYMEEGIYDCVDLNQVSPGYVKENQTKFLHYDLSNDTFYELEPNFSGWSGLFGDSPQDTLSFKYYDQSEDRTYLVNEIVPFTPNMIEGNAIEPFEFTIDYSQYVDGQIDCDFIYNDFEYNGSITSTIQGVEEGDDIAAFVNNECRGIITADDSPFNTTVFGLMTYGNPALTIISSFNQTISVFNKKIHTTNNRDIEYFNIYRDGNLIDSSVNDFYYIDESIDEDGYYCYEIVLTDQNGVEILTSMEQCIDLALESDDALIGDLNGDDQLNVVDVVMLVTFVLNGTEYSSQADLNGDGSINVVDVVMMVSLILNN